MRSGGVALDGVCREGGMFAFSAIRLKLAFSKISYCTFNRGVMVHVFVLNRFCMGLSDRYACAPNEYSIFFFRKFK